jgi:hypothetical protein
MRQVNTGSKLAWQRNSALGCSKNRHLRKNSQGGDGRLQLISDAADAYREHMFATWDAALIT